jgi:hypothetical protein
MVETITPVVHGGRGRWLGAVALHALGAGATAAAFGAALGFVGSRLGAPWGRAGFAVVASLAILYAVGEHPSVPVPVPQLRRQVPDWWRTFFGRWVAAVLYGAGLGVGFATYLSGGTLVVVAGAAVAAGRPAIGAVVMAPFGLVRGLSALAAWNAGSSGSGRTLVDRLVATPEQGRRVANTAALLVVASLAAAGALHSHTGSWWRIGAAMLALAFAWACAAKLASMRAWRASLDAHPLPRWVVRSAMWAVPIAEAFVPALVLAGLPRLAGAWAVMLLGAFSLELVVVKKRIGSAVPCGCFGSRRAVPLGVALGRNATLVAVGLAVAAWGRDAVLTWPGLPTVGELLPVLVTSTSVVMAAVTAWRASGWLSRGIRS